MANTADVSAEVVVEAGQEQRAAAALQRLGFRVLHVGSTISITGSEDMFSSVFKFSFRTATAETSPGRIVKFRLPEQDIPVIPATLRGLINGVYVARPPELH